MIRTETASSRSFAGGQPHPLEHDLPQAFVFTAFALVLILTIPYIFYRQPVLYPWLVAEDHFGENIQVLGFAVTAFLMLALALRPGPLPRRIIWALIGLLAFFIAGEEISWGERILDRLMGISYPEAVRELNRQAEFNIHNLASQNLVNRTHKIAALGLLPWLGISFILIGWWPHLAQRLDGLGVPLIPAQFYGLFLIAISMRLTDPVARKDEIWELFLALAVSSWAFHIYLRHRRPRAAVGRRGVAAWVVLVSALALFGALTAPIGSHDSLTGSYNTLAWRDYPARGLYAQADELFAYIYRNPEHELHDTRLDHARLLMGQGRDDKAAALLRQFIRRAAEKAGEELTILDQRGLAIAYAALGEAEQSQAFFERAIEANRAKIEEIEDGDEKAVLYWELARTLEAAGDREGAIAAIETGIEAAASAAPAASMKKWLDWSVNIYQN